MEDAYVIGIRLVLENGVSAGVEAIGRDLAVFDRALAATTGNVQVLRDLGAGMAAPAATERPARETVRAKTALAAPPPQEAPLPVRTAAKSGRSPEVRPVARPPAPAPWETALARAPRCSVRDEEDGAIKGAGRPAAMSAPLLPGPARAAVAEAPAAGPLSALTAREVFASEPGAGRGWLLKFADFAPTQAGARTTVPWPDATVQEASAAGAVPTFLASVTAGAEARPSPPVQSSADWSSASAARAPQGGGASRNGRLLRLAPTLAPALPAAAPVAPSAAAGPVQGDVYLDGARMGRWMADRLAREADRPPTGMTGFDPRLGVAWPGAMHGT